MYHNDKSLVLSQSLLSEIRRSIAMSSMEPPLSAVEPKSTSPDDLNSTEDATVITGDDDGVSVAEQQTGAPADSSTFVAPPVISSIEDPTHEPQVIAGIEDPGMGGRFSSSIAELTNRVSSAMRDSSSTVSRAIKNVVPVVPAVRSPCPMIVCFGDSITERGCTVANTDWGVGWSAHLADRFAARADVLTRGFSGYNSSNAVQFLRKAMRGPAEHASAVLVWFGANDAVLKGRGSQHVSIEEYILNLSKLVFEIRDLRKGSPIVPILVTPPPIQQELHDLRSFDRGDTAGPIRTNENTSMYSRACMDVGKRMRTPCIDMFTAMSEYAGDQEGLKRFLYDGLHLTSEGNRFVGETIYNHLRDRSGLFQDDMAPRWFPHWTQLNPESTINQS